MPSVLDYSAGRPTGAAVRAAEYVGVVRYAGTPGRTKNITGAEFRDMDANSVGVALVYENHAGDALDGRAAGVAAAGNIGADAAAIGFPADRPFYFAVDQDITTQMGAVLDYFRGIVSVIGVERTGVYGEADVLDAVIGAGLATYGWQTAAWSHGLTARTRHLYQLVGYVSVGGLQCDRSVVFAADWGQHNFAAAAASNTTANPQFGEDYDMQPITYGPVPVVTKDDGTKEQILRDSIQWDGRAAVCNIIAKDDGKPVFVAQLGNWGPKGGTMGGKPIAGNNLPGAGTNTWRVDPNLPGAFEVPAGTTRIFISVSCNGRTGLQVVPK